MSTRFEYVPPDCGVWYGNELDLAVDNGGVEAPEDQDVLVLSYDECIVIPGTSSEILAFARRVEATVLASMGENGRAKMEQRTCTHCDREIRYTAGVDPSVPWVHVHSGNAACDVDVPEDAVMFAGTPDRDMAEPEDGWLDERGLA